MPFPGVLSLLICLEQHLVCEFCVRLPDGVFVVVVVLRRIEELFFWLDLDLVVIIISTALILSCMLKRQLRILSVTV